MTANEARAEILERECQSPAPIGLADVYGRMRTAIRTAGSQRAYADALGITPSFLNQVLNGVRPPTDAMLRKIGLRRVTMLLEIAR